ncbi:unnamed protein product [Camellia sinensis]
MREKKHWRETLVQREHSRSTGPRLLGLSAILKSVLLRSYTTETLNITAATLHEKQLASSNIEHILGFKFTL